MQTTDEATTTQRTRWQDSKAQHALTTALDKKTQTSQALSEQYVVHYNQSVIRNLLKSTLKRELTLQRSSRVELKATGFYRLLPVLTSPTVRPTFNGSQSVSVTACTALDNVAD